MKLKYSKSYYDNYYNGSYEETYRFAFSPERLLELYSNGVGGKPTSFADIGCGPGQTLEDMGMCLPEGSLIYGVESQQIPKDRQASGKILFDDFMTADNLKPVDLLYVSCSMYIPWEEQENFIHKCLNLANKAVCFANVYLSDRDLIPYDSERLAIYKSKASFEKAIESIGGWKSLSPVTDFFLRTSQV